MVRAFVGGEIPVWRRCPTTAFGCTKYVENRSPRDLCTVIRYSGTVFPFYRVRDSCVKGLSLPSYGDIFWQRESFWMEHAAHWVTHAVADIVEMELER